MSKPLNIYKKRGIIIIWFVFLLPIILFFISLIIDIGYQELIKYELQNIADAAAYAGGQDLIKSNKLAIEATKGIISKNTILGNNIENEFITIKLGRWNYNKKSFEYNKLHPNALLVTLAYPVSYWFSSIFLSKKNILHVQAISYHTNHQKTILVS